ncbi:IPT/TIG domain-containing protein [Actinoplanes sp. NPDC051470]|uniref:IPT/TIG domain-containing protein n=1 Tax=Actinoplanes sp. NPDC051470 TaxID=3157224 RepID=UPI00343675B7
MRQLYTSYYNVWVNNGGGMLAAFSAADAPSKWGTFGLLEYQDQPVANAPKFRATLDFMTGLRARPVREIASYVTGLSVRTGTKLGGTEIVISGNRLASARSVTFGGTAAKFRKVVDSDVTRLVAVAPAHAAGVVDVVVSGPAGGSLTGSATTFAYTAPPPTITRLSITKIPAKGGTAVTVTGTSFTGTQSVMLGGTAATSVKVLSDTRLRFVSPATSAGPVDVAVRTPYGTSAVLPGSRLTVG